MLPVSSQCGFIDCLTKSRDEYLCVLLFPQCQNSARCQLVTFYPLSNTLNFKKMTCLSDCKVNRLRKACCQAWKVRTVWNQQLKLKWNPQEKFICLLARKVENTTEEPAKLSSVSYITRENCEITIHFIFCKIEI